MGPIVVFSSIFKVAVRQLGHTIYKVLVSCKIEIARVRLFARAFLL